MILLSSSYIYDGSSGAATPLGSPNTGLGRAGVFDSLTLTKWGNGYQIFMAVLQRLEV